VLHRRKAKNVDLSKPVLKVGKEMWGGEEIGDHLIEGKLKTVVPYAVGSRFFNTGEEPRSTTKRREILPQGTEEGKSRTSKVHAGASDAGISRFSQLG